MSTDKFPITPGPYKACRSNEEFSGPLFDADGCVYPFKSIESAHGAIVHCHDLAEIKPGDAVLLAASWDLLEQVGRSIMGEDLDIWPDDLRKDFGFPRAA